MVPERGTELPEGIEARHGVTPPMRDARRRRFRKLRGINPAFMRQVEEVVLLIASVSLWPPPDSALGHGERVASLYSMLIERCDVGRPQVI